MRYKIVAIRDRAADVFGVPQFTGSVGTAIRGFADEVNKKDTVIGQHPDDFDLYELGEFDDAEGVFYSDRPRQVAVGKDLVK